MRRCDLLLLVCAVLGGALCFSHLGRLWPLVEADLFAHQRPAARAERAIVAAAGLDPDHDRREARLRVDEPALDYLQRAFGQDGAQRWIRDGVPALSARATWKRAGDADPLTVALHPDGRVLGWSRAVQEDAAGARLDAAAAERMARAALRDALGLDDGAYQRTQVAVLERPARRDHQLAFERRWSDAPELRERVEVLVAGDRVLKAMRAVAVPAAYERSRRADDGEAQGLQALGTVGLVVAALAALAVFLARLRRGEVRLGRCAALSALLFVLLLVVDLGQRAVLHEQWDALTPRLVGYARTLVEWQVDNVAVLIAVLAFVAAGDALDRAPAIAGQVSPRRRGETLWLLARGRWTERGVIAASLRGFLIGLICGGVLTLAVEALTAWAGAEVVLQPRGFFFFPLNSAWPVATSLCFFLYIAALEELGYRFFAGTWLARVTRRRWLAIAAPAVVYGLMHSTLTFLPPAHPCWARPLTLALVGMVWGVAFFRFDALTVVLSHWACDLFIFTWPLLASRDPTRIATAVAVVCAPLAPALIGLLIARWPRATAASVV